MSLIQFELTLSFKEIFGATIRKCFSLYYEYVCCMSVNHTRTWLRHSFKLSMSCRPQTPISEIFRFALVNNISLKHVVQAQYLKCSSNWDWNLLDCQNWHEAPIKHCSVRFSRFNWLDPCLRGLQRADVGHKELERPRRKLGPRQGLHGETC